MSYTSPWATFRDRVRAIMQDTDESNEYLPDAEYDDFIDVFGEQEGAAQIATAIATQNARKITKFAQTGDISVEWRERVEHFRWLASGIRSGVIAISDLSGGMVFTGTPTVGVDEAEHYDTYDVWPTTV